MTLFLCQSLCSEYQFAGVESGTECYCGNSPRNNGASGSVVPDSHCHLSCGGDSGQKCGGHWMMSLYAQSAPPRSVECPFIA
ncbi:hypothetical protein BD779DRAFT_1582023 [Infundibulicybe gibba]|nr:hypothetical protein BD779DRAFT_1582023 [Infundibulicybe gibba]